MNKNRNISLNKYKRMLMYFKPFVPLILLAIVLAALVNGSELAGPYITKIVIDDYIVGGGSVPEIVFLGILFIVSVLGGTLANYFQVLLLNRIGQKIMHNIRMELFSHIQSLPLGFFDRNSSGRILTRVTNDVEALNEMYSGVLVALFKDIFLLSGITIVMVRMNLKLALVSFSVIPLIVLITYFYNKKARWNYKRVRNLISRINGFFAENISGMKLVQIFNREKEKYAEFSKLNSEYNEASLFEVKLMALFKPSTEFISSLATALLIWYFTPKLFDSVFEIGILFAFISYVKKFFSPIQDLADKYNVIISGTVAAERIFELMDEKTGQEDLNKGIHIENVKGEIEFKNVWFSYNENDWVLKDVSFRVRPGETVAFVGATGSGKSTIINLIGRFYEIQKGEILLDGMNIREISLGDLRRNICVVMQDVFLFSGDIRSNICLNDTSITDEEVEAAALCVNATGFIQNLPDGFAEEVKERGCTLSAGQRQLLSFARAIAFKPAILVLDEATANIDTETEKIIQESLEKVSKDRTTLVIAHRLSTIKDADRIIVINKGRVREVGRHRDLLLKEGIYRKLYDMQYA